MIVVSPEFQRALAIVLSLLAALGLAFGAQFQNQAAEKKAIDTPSDTRVGIKALLRLVSRPRWLLGMTFLMTGGIFQISALVLAPLIVVQPLGAIALVITSLLNARSTKTRINKPTWWAIGLCTFGIAVFVAASASVAKESHLDDGNLAQILIVLVVLCALFAISFFTFAKKAKATTYIVGAAILYGFVASLIKAVVQRIAQGDFSLLTLVCLLVSGIVMLLGGWFVQNAYASGPPELVIAGLTVMDPMVAVSIGVIILGEAKQASALTLIVFVSSALVAVLGVWLLSRFHPEMLKKS
jgi:drug/metabolite transporter (DMT)-like permease